MRSVWFGLIFGIFAFAQRGPGNPGHAPESTRPPSLPNFGYGAFGPPRAPARPAPRSFAYGFGYFPSIYPYYDYPAEPPAPELPPAPPVVIVQQPPPQAARPVVHDYAPREPAAAAAAEENQAAFAIVLKDGSTRSAAAVTVQDDVVHYVDSDGGHVRIPLDSIDRQATRRANRERGLDLALPAPAR